MCTSPEHATLTDQVRVLTDTNAWLRAQLDQCKARASAPLVTTLAPKPQRTYSYPHAHIHHESDGWHVDLADRDERIGVRWMRDVDVEPTQAAAIAWLTHAEAVFA